MNRKLRIFIVLLVLFLFLVSASYFLFKPVETNVTENNKCNFKLGGPISVSQLAKCDFYDGDVVELNGKIASVDSFFTNYGNYSLITLKDDIYDGHDNPLFYILANKSMNYTVGEEFKKTLHLKEIQINGNIIFSAEEFGIHLISLSSIRVAIDATSNVSGIELILKSSEDGITQYEVFTKEDNGYPIDSINATLKKGIKSDGNFLYVNKSMIYGESPLGSMSVGGSETLNNIENYEFSEQFTGAILFCALEYLSVSGGYADSNTIDSMKSLNDSTSDNGFIEFVDVNSNSLIDDHDIFIINITPTTNPETFETYFLLIGTDNLGENFEVAAGFKYILNWYDGAFEGTYLRD